ncbi:response regulator transcription factor [Caballeronia sp. BR00000012568055]|uniref:LuxR family transcriptional regulator n=1 Tax=Caballeronia sp. BR00000012568055 TaxID=2918761 RepID=UPI0023F745D8|nr:response regulator transcription factor [Caballeronia sp. BR00000012568055]
MKINVMGPNAERRAGLKTLLRRVARQAQFYESIEWPPQPELHGRGDKPDMIVIDWTPGMRPMELQALLSTMPEVPAAIMIDRPTAAQVLMLLAAGAMGIIPRALDPILVLRAFEMVMIGGHYIPSEIFDAELGRESMLRRSQDKATVLRRIRKELSLSPRQQQIMRCVHMGSTNKMIARMLGISEGTVKIHLTGIFQQLGATNRAAAVAIYNGVQASHLEVLRSNSVEVDRASVEPVEPIAPVEQPESETGGDGVAAPAIAAVITPVEEPERENEPATAAEKAREDTPANKHIDPSEPAHATGTNIIPLPIDQPHYSLLNPHNSTSLPLAAQPDSPF